MLGKCIKYAIQNATLPSPHIIIIFFRRVNLFRKFIRRVTSLFFGKIFFLRGVTMRLFFKLFFFSHTTRYSGSWLIISFGINTVYVFQMSRQVVITYCVIRALTTFKGIHCVHVHVQTTNEGKLRFLIQLYEPSKQAKRASRWASKRAYEQVSKQASIWAGEQASNHVSRWACKQASKRASIWTGEHVSKQASKHMSRWASKQAYEQVSM